ncbi:hypothetical protein BIZ37_18305 [Photobacterium sp. BZF1]|uniref:Uncharacterized protein n=1 Tax=Photobacterium rosenbergii TaxID=294936 RepID=A0A2T3NKI3_9GAMM|nr:MULTISPECIES: hypothetical protein [Photobacterium]MBC7004519.1 hypothetical protein [Photobacterium sp. BZF1]MBY5948278.1 hypothetical protein [Photobacterium rosenbergii]PSW15989.1 hypothetical protein C9J01_02990 [Photobacterium rosenbergii]
MGIAFHPDSELDDVKLTQLHEELLSKKAHFKDEIIKLNQVIAKKEDCSVTDVAEAANIREEADRAMGLVEQYTETLALIEKALSHMEHGTYGVSDKSGNPIPFERLKIIPWTSTCADD